MITAQEIKAGQYVLLEKKICKVMEAVVHTGGGKTGTMVHLKLKDAATAHVSEKRFAADEKLEDVQVDRVKMQFLYKDGDAFTFMNPQSFEQIAVDKGVVGPAAAFLKENEELELELFEGKPLAVLYQKAVELRVVSTGAALQGVSTFKEAGLENGMTALVPQFIKEGDAIRVEVETGKYVERVSEREEKGAKFTTAAPPVKKEASPVPKGDSAKSPEKPPKDKK